jgi:hypothetical protein
LIESSKMNAVYLEDFIQDHHAHDLLFEL